ncbi:uridine kinase [Actinophytocola sp.]|uniref:uridine kinase n=1 Tax=Actinophytocola sp. TaxID=1872138 RepID=UPI002ED1BDA1
MRFRPISPDLLITEIAETIITRPGAEWTRVAVDGAPPSEPGTLADRLAEELRTRGRPVRRVSAADFLRPASLRFEHGRTDPDARYDSWLDVGALTREVFEPLDAGGTGRILPSFWNTSTDRATRADYVDLPPGGVLVLDGELLLGRGLPVDCAVHLWLSPAALRRRLPEAEAWALPVFERYHSTVHPLDQADFAVRMDDPAHPALLDE